MCLYRSQEYILCTVSFVYFHVLAILFLPFIAFLCHTRCVCVKKQKSEIKNTNLITFELIHSLLSLSFSACKGIFFSQYIYITTCWLQKKTTKYINQEFARITLNSVFARCSLAAAIWFHASNVLHITARR